MSDEEREGIVDVYANDPEAGAIMPGCGGARKKRFPKPGSGKSGGYRVISAFLGLAVPVVLMTVFGKNEKDNLTMAERNALAALIKSMKDAANNNK